MKTAPAYALRAAARQANSELRSANPEMKTAYELAMERLNQDTPMAKLTEEQKKELAELDSLYASKIAAREIHLNGQIEKAMAEGDFEAMEKYQQSLTQEKQELAQELEAKKETVRKQAKG